MEKNMLRERSKGLDPITKEEYESFNEDNTEIVEEFLENSTHLSKQSLKQYTSALSIFLKFVKDKLKNKPVYEISKREFLKYMTFLQNEGLSSSALKLKKSAVSSLVNYIETFVVDDDERYSTFRNFTKGLPAITSNKVYDKVKVTKEECDFMLDALIEKKKYLQACWLAVAFNTGMRRNEIRQLKTEVVNYDFGEKEYVDSHKVRGKGKSEDGKILTYMINKDAMKYIRLYIDNRDFESEFIFATKGGLISEGWANDFCSRKLSKLLDRRINPHIMRSSSATYLMEQGVDITKISKYVLHHESLETTQLYLIKDENEEKDSIF